MSKSCVYMHICPNSKVYIGQAIDPVSRWNNGNGYINNKEFYSDIKKYGWDNIGHEILFDYLTKEEANKIEEELILKYESFNPQKGYNQRIGNKHPKAMKPKQKITVKLDKELYKKLKIKMAYNDKKIQDLIEELLIQYIEK